MSNVNQGLGQIVSESIVQALLRASLAASGRGRKAKAPRIWIRADRLTDGEPTCYALFRGKPYSLGMPASQEVEARQFLTTTILAVEARARGIVAPRDVSVKVILEWYRDDQRCLYQANRHRRRAHRTMVTRTTTLLRRLGEKTLGDLDGVTVTRYIQARMRDVHGAYSKTEDAPRVSLSTACDDVGHLRRAIQAYVAFFQIPWMPAIKVPEHFTRREFLIDRHHFARILEACRGYIWDGATDDWLKEEVVDPVTGDGRLIRVRRRPDTVDHRRAVSRLLRICMYSGTRHSAVIGLKWRMHARGGCIDRMRNVIHRAGYGDSPEHGKPQLSSAMRHQLAILMWIWERKDRPRGITHVVHKLDGTEFKGRLSGTVREVMADACIPQACAHSFRHAAITWMMIDGYDVATTADIIGVSEKTVWKVYRQRNLKSQQLAVGPGRLPVAKDWSAERLDAATDRDTGAANFGNRPSFRQKVRVLQRPPSGRAVRKPDPYRTAC
ncbi:hypothetical protein MKK63_25245 [Methylobacterium sp. J-088]|uniref:hypothetical protein n=1 Tax=Methylobacterium sp. J-088 TaxID=2836664 RepID=UPI001FB9301F|nr:hypothetical protein [Methylobacterium sp. J-088]MCJ2065987.1 hypothetical protein [Methylobacterium sp. J-088]